MNVTRYSKLFPQSNDVGGGNIIINTEITDNNTIVSADINYIDKSGKLIIKYEFNNGEIKKYISNSPYEITMPPEISLSDMKVLFVKDIESYMKEHFENLTVYQNEKDDWIMKQIKRKQYESTSVITQSFEDKVAASLKPAMDYLDEVIKGHERYLKQQAEQKEKEKIAEIQKLSGTTKK